MALSYAVRRHLLAASLPEATEVRLELQDYLARTGMTPPDFARRINYARETIYQFLNGHYSRISSNDGPIRAAIRGFIAAHPIATPVVSSGKLYQTENARLLRQYFYEALDHGRAYYLYGAPGTQKTYVLQHLIADLNRLSVSERSLQPDLLQRRPQPDRDPGLHCGPPNCDSSNQCRQALRNRECPLVAPVLLRDRKSVV